ncbi:flavin-binding monooxygenase-like protein [Botrytis cinerea]
MSQDSKVDLVVVGAGWFGLAGAKTYLQVHPNANVVVLADNATIGVGLPITTEKYGVKPGEYIPGSVVHQYLEDFAKEYNVYDKIRFESKAISAEHQDESGWIVTVGSSSFPATFEEYKISTSKLIVATGLTSMPFVPPLPGIESFTPPVFHTKEFPNHLDTLETAKSVCVFGGAKSAFDMAYAYASKGIHVDWIIRESGHGPGWMSESYATPLKIWIEKMVNTRILSWFSPCIYGDYDGYGTVRSWLHGTVAGRWFVDKYWANSGNEIKTVNGYDKHPETAKLKPWTDSFYVGAMLSILNHNTDIFELVRKGAISVHIGDIVNLSANTVSLSNGEKIQTDAFVCATGWKHTPPLEFLPRGIDLGLPHTPGSEEPTDLIKRADAEILSKFPKLKDEPLATFMAQFQALWATAFFNNKVSIPSDVEYQTVLHSRFGKWRYPSGYGARHPDSVFDGLPYYDMLLKDMGLRSHRKSSWFWEIFEPYSAKDYVGVVDELKQKIMVEKGDVKSSAKVLLEGRGGLVRIGGKVDASGQVTIRGAVEVGNVESSGKIIVESLEKQRIVLGDLQSRGGMEIEGDVEIRNELKASGNVKINGKLHVHGNFTVHGNVKIQAGSELIVNGRRTIHGRMENA